MKRFLAALLVLMLLASVPALAEFKGFRLDIPEYYQTDYTDVQVVWRGEPKSVATSGCGAACTAMIIAYYNNVLWNGEKEAPDPKEIFQQEIENGGFRGNGLSHTSLRKILHRYGIQSKWRMLNRQAIIRILQEGRPIVVHVGKGYFTNNVHYVLLAGLTDDQELIVIDPNSRDKSKNYTYRIASLMKQVYGEYPFLVCYNEVPNPPGKQQAE
ncbi:MAG: C39 family peptidase [Clostridia bacterium]|nr:C39 family peptidase [Clostridia bacterium]